MTAMRLVLPATALMFGGVMVQGVQPPGNVSSHVPGFVSGFISGAQASDAGGGVGANERSVEIIDYTTFRRRLARLSGREAREYAENLFFQSSARESSSGIPVIEGFTAAQSIRIFHMIMLDPVASERLLRRLDGVTDIEARRDILERATADALHEADLKKTAADRAGADRTRDPEDVERLQERSSNASSYYHYLQNWTRYPERGIPRDRPEN
ncbi:MAG: hypothetical protein K8F25_09885 [Fimbriimonadaceae bacterium]|nr:hypothetical protein [Alphaproteobacteria bacterium]